MERDWIIGDVFTTTFWGVTEVCIINKVLPNEIFFIRLEAIRGRKGIKKDFCGAVMTYEMFGKISKTFLHHSNWYYEYK